MKTGRTQAPLDAGSASWRGMLNAMRCSAALPSDWSSVMLAIAAKLEGSDPDCG